MRMEFLRIVFLLLFPNVYSKCQNGTEERGELKPRLNSNGFYLSNENQIWYKCTLPGYYFLITIEHFDLERSWSSCFDYLKITDQSNDKLILNRCGKQQQTNKPTFRSYSNEIKIQFRTDNIQSNKTGFKLKWNSIVATRSNRRKTTELKNYKNYVSQFDTTLRRSMSTYKRNRTLRPSASIQNHDGLSNLFTKPKLGNQTFNGNVSSYNAGDVLQHTTLQQINLTLNLSSSAFEFSQIMTTPKSSVSTLGFQSRISNVDVSGHQEKSSRTLFPTSRERNRMSNFNIPTDKTYNLQALPRSSMSTLQRRNNQVYLSNGVDIREAEISFDAPKMLSPKNLEVRRFQSYYLYNNPTTASQSKSEYDLNRDFPNTPTNSMDIQTEKDVFVSRGDGDPFMKESTILFIGVTIVLIIICCGLCMFWKIRHVNDKLGSVKSSQDEMNQTLDDIKSLCSGAYVQLDFHRPGPGYLNINTNV